MTSRTSRRRQRITRRKLRRQRYARLRDDPHRMHNWDEMRPGREWKTRAPKWRRYEEAA